MSQYAIDQGKHIEECLASVISVISNPDSSLHGVIQDNEECQKNSIELERLHSALKTYLDTDFDLRYVAFVGAFSSGKTATINNLLRLKDDEKRLEDPNTFAILPCRLRAFLPSKNLFDIESRGLTDAGASARILGPRGHEQKASYFQ